MTDVAGRTGTRFVQVVVVLGALFMLVIGIWMRLWPDHFARVVNFPPHVHFLHDAGVFQIGIGMMMLFALRWRDVIALVLAGFFLTNTLHAVNHVEDLHLGGRATDWVYLTALSLVTLVALVVRLRHLRR
ncbi:hypothetical protein [Allokutzneria oryzae]|uniref:Uncharacterized protein n=1 Tax=Allokutzneria oryzae TaxID=1378989 RepID=A0ABV5ZQG1_9PSEU